MAARKVPVKKAVAKKPTTKKPTTNKPTTNKPTTKKRAARKATASKGMSAKKATSAKKHLPRADRGGPVEPFFESQPPELRRYLEVLRAAVKKAVPEAKESMKWGMPYYELKSGFAALYASTTYAAINIMAPPDRLPDPKGRLEGGGKTMRHLKVRSLDDLDEASLVRWVKIAAAHHS